MSKNGRSGPPDGNDLPTIPTPAGTAPAPSSGGRASRGPVFAPGETLAGRFRILRFIAQGGMGEVYEAEDQVLRVRVALKTIRSDISADAGTLERFLREVHLARQVTHPNVSRIFDVFEQGETKFLTMELLSGETLADRLERTGRLSPEEALPIVEQMASALDAAHAAGIVHRDFKSGNVMLVPDARGGGVRAVVTDFGLARRHRAGSPDSIGTAAAARTGGDAVIGTPDYMAPEQVEGKALTPAVDVYAFGVVLYEMVTGDRPFTGESPITVAIRRLRERPPPPRDRVPDLDPKWEAAILRCLERDPADRFASAADAVRALRGEEVAEAPRRRRGRLLAAAAVFAAAILGAAAIVLLSRGARRSPAAAPPPAAANRTPRPAVAVMGFKNLAGRPEDAWVSTALAEMLTTELAAGERLRAIASEDVARMKGDLALPEADTLSRDTLARVRRRSGADLVLVGSYLVLSPEPGGAVRLDLRLQDAAGGDTLALVSEKGTGAELDALATRAGERLREKLRLGAVSGTDAAAVRAAIPSSPDAARLYAEGLARLRVFDEIGARDLLQKAVAADPKSAPAHAALAAAWSELGYESRALAEAKKAFELSGPLSRESRLVVEGRYREIANEWDRTVEIYRSLFTFFPDNLEYGLHLARAQTRAGRASEALATIAALRRTFGNEDPRVDVAESATAASLSDYPRAERAATRAAELAQKQGARLLVASANLNRASARRNLGDPKGAIPFIEEARSLYSAIGDRGAVAFALNSLGNARYDLGDLPEARRAYEESLAICRQIGSRRSAAAALDNIASVVGDQGDFDSARKLSEEALSIYREIGDRSGEASTLGNIAAALVARGDFRSAKTYFELALPIYRQTGDQGSLAISLNNLAEMEAAQGDLAGARAGFEQAAKIFLDSSQKTKAVYPLAGLAGVLAASGDLAGARKILEEQLPVCRSGGDRHEEAYVRAALGAIALSEGRNDEARGHFTAALGIRDEIGEAGAAAQSRLDLARLALEEGRVGEAEKEARDAVAELARQKSPDDEAVGRALLSRIASARRQPRKAAQELDRARAAAGASQREAVRFELQLASAFARAAAGDVAGARRTLEAAAARASELRLVESGFEARLALVEIEAAAGRAREARAAMDALEKEASAKGYRRIADRAARARNGPVPEAPKNPSGASS